jgi:hypothetical protein
MRPRHVLIDGTGGAGNCESRSFVVRCVRSERSRSRKYIRDANCAQEARSVPSGQAGATNGGPFVPPFEPQGKQACCRGPWLLSEAGAAGPSFLPSNLRASRTSRCGESMPRIAGGSGESRRWVNRQGCGAGGMAGGGFVDVGECCVVFSEGDVGGDVARDEAW